MPVFLMFSDYGVSSIVVISCVDVEKFMSLSCMMKFIFVHNQKLYIYGSLNNNA